MTSESYLRGEARWAREQAGKAKRAADRARLDHQPERDLRWAEQRVEICEADLVKARAELEHQLTTPHDAIAHDQDAERWEQLAREYEARICQVEDQPMWEDVK